MTTSTPCGTIVVSKEREVIKMFYGMIKELLKEKTIWVVLDEGWFYSKPLAVFFDKSSAVAYWESVTLQTYSDEKYIEIAYKEALKAYK